MEGVVILTLRKTEKQKNRKTENREQKTENRKTEKQKNSSIQFELELKGLNKHTKSPQEFWNVRMHLKPN